MILQGATQIAKKLSSEYINLSFKQPFSKSERFPISEADMVELKLASDYIHSLMGLVIAYEFFGEHVSIGMLIKMMS